MIRCSLTVGKLFFAGALLASTLTADTSGSHHGLPDQVTPLDDARRLELEALIDHAQRLRGLELKEPLVAGSQSQDTTRESFAQEIAPEEALDAAEGALRIVGLWSDERPLRQTLLEVLSDQVAGYYDPDAGFLALVEGQDGRPMDALAGFGPTAIERLEESIWVHEIGHALQDQHFDLAALLAADGSLFSDKALARRSLVEGDAMVMSSSYTLSVAMERFPMAQGFLTNLSQEPGGLAAMVPEQGSETLAAAPAYLQHVLGFPYVGGLEFCLALRRAGGQKLLDFAFSDPPTSTEQILHPEKWLQDRDEPVELVLPDLAPHLTGRSLALEGGFGELTLRILLAEHLPDGSRATIQEAAGGWGGDRFAFYRRDSDDAGVLAWLTEWDEAQDAEQFRAVIDSVLTDARIASSETRVAMVLGASEQESSPVLHALLQAEGERRAGTAPDLAALGIDDDDRPRELDAEELAAVFRDPVVLALLEQSLGSGMAEILQVMAEDPELLNLANELGQEMLTSEKSLDELFADSRLVELMSSPKGQELALRMAARMQPVETSFEEGTFRVGDRLSLSLPTDVPWQRMDPDEAGSPGPKPLFQAIEHVTGTTVTVVGIRLPVPTPLEAMVAGAQADSLDGMEVLEQGYGETGDTRYWQRRVLLRYGGVEMGMIQRLHVLGQDFVTFMVTYLGSPEPTGLAQTVLDNIAIPAVEPGTPAEKPRYTKRPDGEMVPLQVQDNVQKPRKISSPAPAYPEDARSERVEGVVVLQTIIGKNGKVSPEVKVLLSPDERLSAAAIDAVRTWTFEPATLDGEPVDVYYNLTINFHLEKEDDES